MYVKNSHPIREYFQNTANLYVIKESRSTAYPEFKAHSNETHSVEDRSNKTHSNVAHIEEGLELIDLESLPVGCQGNRKNLKVAPVGRGCVRGNQSNLKKLFLLVAFKFIIFS